jgi:hypothetical protein
MQALGDTKYRRRQKGDSKLPDEESDYIGGCVGLLRR